MNIASLTEREHRRRTAGFTLVELLVVLVILGLLAGLVAPRVLPLLVGSRQDAASLQIEHFKTALNFYRLDLAAYPTTQQGLQALVTRPNEAEGWNGPYLEEVPKDPWGQDYVYKSPGDHGDFDLSSLGSDNRQGGEGENADITSW